MSKPQSPSDLPDQTRNAHLHETHNDTKNNAKTVSMQVLQARMVEGIDLSLVTKQAHWNLKGPQFIGVHKMLDKFRDELDGWNDMMAERITQLGGTARGTLQDVSRETGLKPYPTDIYTVADHINQLIERYAVVANAVRDGIGATDEAGDAGTADLLTEVSRGIDKQLWFLEAHVQEPGHFRQG